MRVPIIIAVFYSFFSFGQSVRYNYFGFTAGLSFNIGSHFNSVGIITKGYYTDYFYQINIGSSTLWNFNNYGNRKRFWENRTYLGLQLLGGKKNNLIDFNLDGLTHQTKYSNAIGYNYIWYTDNIGTSQRSGGWSLSINKIGIYFENDVFGGQAKDRYRTGHILITYRDSIVKYGLGFSIWTGETNNSEWIHISTPKCPYGYRSLENNPFGKTSNGILYGSVQYLLPYGQIAYIKSGIDSENLRHAIQNRFIHDLVLLPKKIERKTPHYPRLNAEGLPTFEKDSVRPTKFFFETGINNNWCD